MATTRQSRLDDLVQSVTLYNPRSLLWHSYVLPFVVLQAAWIYGWVFVYGVSEHYEAGLVGIAAIAVVQIFTCLSCQWSVHVHTFFNYSPVSDPTKASLVKVVPTPNNGSCELMRIHQTDDKQPWFNFQKTKYVWDSEKKQFRGLEFPIHNELQHYYEWKGHSSEKEIRDAEDKYGDNKMDMVVPEFKELFRERAIAPFFVFQVFCVALWCLDKYWYYSIFTLFMLIMFECTLVQQQLRNMAMIRNMGNKPYMINVYRNRRWGYIFTDQLVPGDIVSITRSQNDNLVPCDMLLLRGPCIVDESMLTGESVPQMKEPISDKDEQRSLDMGLDKLHILFGGTKVVQHSPPSKASSGLRATDNGCIAYVLRTGFNTSQGKLLRTILFGVKRVTANNLETFCFILFLLIFAIAAASYVWVIGTQDPKRNRYKLFLECTLILTSVVPPELPLELSLAVNSSLLALSKLGVFCTEPFRIPFAGKVEICCFDKTGTLTSDDLVVEGVAGVNGKKDVIQLSEAPPETIQVLATCHSLVQLEDGIVGDPLEKATLSAVNWNLTKSDVVIPKKGRGAATKIVHRFHFSSALKRMSVLAAYSTQESSQSQYIVTVKGAPEIIKSMFSTVPEDYDSIYLKQSRRGARVLALGYKKLNKSLTSQELRTIKREEIECELTFVGFVVISCPLKPDSKAVIKEIQNSSHSVVMITGDNPLTACHVSKELHLTKKAVTLILVEQDGKWLWESVDGKTTLPLVPSPSDLPKKYIWESYALCITGEGLKYLKDHEKEYFKEILPHVVVFARCAPKQKEFIILSLKNLGFTTLMCGDGTNDVGALKHAHVGVAILSSLPEHFVLDKIEKEPPRELTREIANSPSTNPRLTARQQNMVNTKAKIQKWLQEAEEQNLSTIVKLGDASIAAPFTSKLSSIQCICHVIKQGRCTLVTTLQMFKILALDALILAYSQSVLYMDGIKFSDYQATLQGVLLALCFLSISCSKPLKTLSKQRPLPNIFNTYTILTVLLQFMVHFFSLIYLVRQAKLITPKADELGRKNNAATAAITSSSISTETDENKEDKPFEVSIINSTVYLVTMTLQVSTFAVNYWGMPFMESITQNKLLVCSIFGSIVYIFALACGFLPDIAETFEIVDFPEQFRQKLVLVLVLNFVLALAVDRLCRWLFGEGKHRKL